MAMLAGWSAAMAAMMLPSEWTLLRLAHATTRSATLTAALAAGYVAVWLAIGAALMELPVMLPAVPVLLAAAAYQLTPLKRRCLKVCRAPLARVVHHWRDGVAGSFRMGIEQGISCLGCCIGLTLTLVALGMTSVLWLVVFGAAILVEKTTRISVGVAAAVLAVGALVSAL